MDYHQLLQLSFWQTWLSVEFNRGYALGAGCLIGLLLIYFLLRVILFLVFRTHRCKAIEIPGTSGTVMIEREALEGAIRQLLTGYPELTVRSLKLYVRGHHYQLRMFCSFTDGGKGLPEVLEQLKPELLDQLKTLFGITTLRRIDVKVEELLHGSDLSAAAKAAAGHEGDDLAAPEVTTVPYGSASMF